MKSKTFIPLVIGLGVGGVAIKLGVDMIKRAQGAQGTLVKVVTAAATIEAAEPLGELALSVTSVPQQLVPQGAFGDPGVLRGRVAKTLIPKGTNITEQMLAPPGTAPGLSSRIPDGYRAVSVKVDEASSVAGFITPSSFVDVSAVFSERVQGVERASSRIILQNVRVGAVGQSLSSIGPDGKSTQLSRSVTLLVRPDEVPKLQMACTRGQIHLALRNGRDRDERPTDGRKLSDLLSVIASKSAERKPRPVAQVVAKVEKPRQHVVEVFRGARVERIVFSEAGRPTARTEVDLTTSAAPAQQEPPPSNNGKEVGE